jgi:hypothetical protein
VPLEPTAKLSSYQHGQLKNRKKYIRSVKQILFFWQREKRTKKLIKKRRGNLSSVRPTNSNRQDKKQQHIQEIMFEKLKKKKEKKVQHFLYFSWFHFQFSLSSVCRHEPALSHTFTHGYFVERLATAKTALFHYSDHFKNQKEEERKNKKSNYFNSNSFQK